MMLTWESPAGGFGHCRPDRILGVFERIWLESGQSEATPDFGGAHDPEEVSGVGREAWGQAVFGR